MPVERSGASDRPLGPQSVIGHRGACAYAPEHTLQSYELALRQGADSVEQDLQVTRDGVLICLHDLTLERTTNVRDVYPDRGRDVIRDGERAHVWFARDFTLGEIKQLDAGAWFGDKFAGSRIATFQEVVDCVGQRGTLCVELKDMDVYETLGIDVLSMFALVLRKNGFGGWGPGQPLMTVQSFHQATVQKAKATLGRRFEFVLLIEAEDAEHCSAPERLRRLALHATGIGPAKSILEDRPEIVGWAHAAGLRVTPWTFRAPSPGRFAGVRDEMAHYLRELDVDAVITDNPDQAPPLPANRGANGSSA